MHDTITDLIKLLNRTPILSDIQNHNVILTQIMQEPFHHEAVYNISCKEPHPMVCFYENLSHKIRRQHTDTLINQWLTDNLGNRSQKMTIDLSIIKTLEMDADQILQLLKKLKQQTIETLLLQDCPWWYPWNTLNQYRSITEITKQTDLPEEQLSQLLTQHQTTRFPEVIANLCITLNDAEQHNRMNGYRQNHDILTRCIREELKPIANLISIKFNTDTLIINLYEKPLITWQLKNNAPIT